MSSMPSPPPAAIRPIKAAPWSGPEVVADGSTAVPSHRDQPSSMTVGMTGIDAIEGVYGVDAIIPGGGS